MANMQYVDIPYVNKKVSRIFYGTAGNDFMFGKNCNDLLDEIYATGVNTFDTARRYLMSEKALGRWINERGLRDQVVISTKCCHPSILGKKRVNEVEMRKDWEASSKALGTDYIDIYLLHRDDPDMPVGEIVEAFNALHAEGKIGAFGGSNWTYVRVQEANEYAYRHGLVPFSVSSPNYGLAEQVRDPWGGGCTTISGPQNESGRKWYAEQNMPIIAYSSLGRGLFSGRVRGDMDLKEVEKVLDGTAMKGYGYPQNMERLRRVEEIAAEKGFTVPQIAMAWIYQQPVNTFAVVSTHSGKRMQDNIDALHIDLTPEEVLYLDLKSDHK